MKARGGYLSAFLLGAVFLWLLFREGKSTIAWLALGLVTALVYYCQPLWLPGLFCFLAYEVLELKAYKKLLFFLSGVAPIAVVLEIVKANSCNMWAPKVFTSKPNVANAVSMLYSDLHGYCYLDDVFPAPLSARIFAVLFMAIIVMLVIAAVYYLLTDCVNRKLFIFSVLAVLLTFFYSLFITGHPSRYLLPITGFGLLALFFFLKDLKSINVLTLPSAILVFVGLMAVFSFRNFSFMPYSKAQLRSCCNYLEEHKLYYVFSNDVPQEWQIMFYSGEKIICRESDSVNRYPGYTRAVTRAYYSSSQNTTVVDFSGDLKDMAPRKTITIAKRFYILPDPSARLLKDMEVQF